MSLDGKWGARVTILLSLTTMALASCSDPAAKPVDRANLLVGLDGPVRLKREGWTDYTSVGFGTLLQWSDLLEVEGEASVLCGDLSVVSISGRASCPCPPAPSRLVYRGARFRDEWEGKMNRVPYILYPRHTLVSSPLPLLRWHNTGATSYTVGLVYGGQIIWSQSGVTSSRLRYPEDAPTLRPGIDHLLVVQDDDTGRSSLEDPMPDLGFSVLSKEERTVVEAEREAILAVRSLDEPARDLALAVYYATHSPSTEEDRRLWGDAWLLLESVAQREQDSPVVQLWVGDMLAATTLVTEAEAAYRAALEAAEALGDAESQAEANAGLWRVSGDEGAWEKAIAAYDQLGDVRRVEALREEREEWGESGAE